jgi:hypothetical protein
MGFSAKQPYDVFCWGAAPRENSRSNACYFACEHSIAYAKQSRHAAGVLNATKLGAVRPNHVIVTGTPVCAAH